MAIGLGGLAAVADARWRKRELSHAQRMLAGATGACYLGVSAVGLAISPSHLAFWFQRRPRFSQAVSVLPLLLVAATGGAASPLRRLAVIGVATSTGMRERRQETQLLGVLAWLVWCVQAWATPSRKEPNRGHVRIFGTPLVAFVLASRISVPATLVAYDTRGLVGQLFELTYERLDLQPYEQTITTALTEMREALVAAIASLPQDGVRDHDHRGLALAALGRLEERLGTLEIAARADLSLDRLRSAILPRTTLEKVDAPPTSVSMDPQELRSLLEERANRFAGGAGGLPPAEVTVAEDVTIPGLSRLAVLGALTTAMACNASLHACEPVTTVQVDVRQDGARLVVVITTDGSRGATVPSPHARRRGGLAHIRRQIEALGGTLSLSASAQGVFAARVELPTDTEPGSLGFWSAQIRRLAGDTIADATRIAAIRSSATAIAPDMAREGVRADNSALNLFTVTHATLPLVVEALSSRKLLRHRAFDSEGLVLLLAAVFTFRAASRREGLVTTWVSGAVSRYAFDPPSALRAGVTLRPAESAEPRARERAGAVLAAHIAAMVAGSRRAHAHLTFDDILTVVLVPFLTAAVLTRAQSRIALLDDALSDRLAEVEALNELAASFHSFHPADPKLRLLPAAAADRAVAERLRSCLNAIAESEQALRDAEFEPRRPVRLNDPLARLGRRLKRMGPTIAGARAVRWVWPEARSHHTATVGVADPLRVGSYLAMALGRRVWPARIRLELARDSFEFLPAPALRSGSFRRTAVTAIDLVGRELNHEFGRALDGMWNLRQVDLRIEVLEWTGSIQCELRAWAPPAPVWRSIVDALHDRVARAPLIAPAGGRLDVLERRLEAVGATLVKWDMYNPEEYDLLRTISPPAKRPAKPSIERGAVVFQLHPQEYRAPSIALARRLAERRGN
jgi:hypothetical protein